MAHELAPLDITTIPELDRLTAEVERTRRPRRLRRNGTDVAVLMPSSPAPDAARLPITSAASRPGSVTERTAGVLSRYAKRPPATIAEEQEAFARGVAEQVATGTDA